MLPTVMTIKNTIAAAAAALSIATVSAAPAHAWGDREQGFVAGVATAVIIDKLLKQSRQQRVVRPAPGFSFVNPNPVYVAPRPSGATSLYGTTAARAFNSYSLTERKEIQRTLRGWGYYHGGIDGAFGAGYLFGRDRLCTRRGAFRQADHQRRCLRGL